MPTNHPNLLAEAHSKMSPEQRQEVTNILHVHKYYLKQDSFSQQKYHRECACGHKKKCTNYKITL